MRLAVIGSCLPFLLVLSLESSRVHAEPQGSRSDLSALLERKLDQSALTDTVESPDSISTPQEAMGAAWRMAAAAIAVAIGAFAFAFAIKRSREKRMASDFSTGLSVRESVWVGRGQKILLVTFDNHKVLVGLSGGAIHNLGVFGEDAKVDLMESPIERAAAMREAEQRAISSSNHPEFSDFVKGELANTVSNGASKDPRQRMLLELNNL